MTQVRALELGDVNDIFVHNTPNLNVIVTLLLTKNELKMLQETLYILPIYNYLSFIHIIIIIKQMIVDLAMLRSVYI